MAPLYPMQTGSTFKPNKKSGRKKPNPLGAQKVVDYLDPKYLQRYTNDQGKILPRRITGVSAYQQRRIALAVKYARHLALIPFVASDVA